MEKDGGGGGGKEAEGRSGELEEPERFWLSPPALRSASERGMAEFWFGGLVYKASRQMSPLAFGSSFAKRSSIAWSRASSSGGMIDS